MTLPPGHDPADAPDGFEERLGRRGELPRSTACGSSSSARADRQEAFVRAREVLARAEDSPERQEALRLLADRLDLPRETLGGLAPARGGGRRRASAAERLLDAGARLERDALAGVRRASGAPEAARRARARALRLRAPPALPGGARRDGGDGDAELVALLAELDAGAAEEGIDERTGTELLLRLRERKLRRELEAVAGDLERVRELQAQLARVRHALDELA